MNTYNGSACIWKVKTILDQLLQLLVYSNKFALAILVQLHYIRNPNSVLWFGVSIAAPVCKGVEICSVSKVHSNLNGQSNHSLEN